MKESKKIKKVRRVTVLSEPKRAPTLNHSFSKFPKLKKVKI